MAAVATLPHQDPSPFRGCSPAPASERLRLVPQQGTGAYQPARGGVSVPLPVTVSDGLTVPTAFGPREYANLDHAASTPALAVVKEAVDRALRTYSSVHRGNGYASRVTSAWYEHARAEVARFVNARPDDAVVFTRNTTDSWGLLARVLPADTTVVVFSSEHHSTLLPWSPERTVALPVPRDREDAVRRLDAALAATATEHTLVVVAGASNVTGEVWPLQRVVEAARRHGARVALDAAQYAPHRRIDLAGSGIDYVAFSGHKLYAPFGAGVLAGRADWLDAAEPYLVGGGATASVTQDGITWASGPARHEGGSPNVIGAIALAAACAALAAQRDDIALYEHALAERLRRGLQTIPGVRTHSVFGQAGDRVAVVAFTVDGVDSSLVSTALSVEHGIGVRDGKFCAHLLVDALLSGASALAPRTAVRASLGLANRPEHVDRLVQAVTSIATSGPALDYELQAGCWVLRDDPRDEPVERPW
ncbi:MAG: aminotransferase class V-fold PLP-dependent enzyme [Dermatophilaceae bacterium]